MIPRPAASQLLRSPARAYLIVLAFACPALAATPPGQSESIPRTPVIDGEWWRVSHSPKLPEIDSGPGEVVDHCFFKAANGKWQLWTQIRGAAIGRLFYRWEGGTKFEEQDWTPKGICWRADRESGESWQTGDQEFVHAPHVLVENGRFVLYYGGGPSSHAEHCQVNLATSKNGIDFTRFCDSNGASRIFIGPGWARDPMVLKVGGLYFNYYCADENGTGVICLRTSTQAAGAPWSTYEVVSQGGILGTHRSAQQCPFVVYLDGHYYLFKMAGSHEFRTAVYRSKNPRWFGDNDDQLVTVLKSSASEIIHADNRFYLSSLIPGYKGVQVARLRWEPSPVQRAAGTSP